jgi:uncharacterized membrane protein YtjA (UPF0391 family)
MFQNTAQNMAGAPSCVQTHFAVSVARLSRITVTGPEFPTLIRWWSQLARFRRPEREGAVMLRWAIIFLIVAIIAAVLGFGGIAGDAAWVAKILFFVFLIVFVVSLVLGRRGSRVV